jgi:hypothetical protein
MKAAKLLGLVMITLVCAWDVDAMRVHIVAHSWLTLSYVSIFLAGHMLDYLTVGRIVNRLEWVTV